MPGEKTKVTWSIDKELVKAARHEAIEREKATSSIVEEALRKFLKKNSSKFTGVIRGERKDG